MRVYGVGWAWVWDVCERGVWGKEGGVGWEGRGCGER